MKKLDRVNRYNVCNAVEGHYLQNLKIVHHHANGRYDLLISEHQSVNPSRQGVSILSKKYKVYVCPSFGSLVTDYLDQLKFLQ